MPGFASDTVDGSEIRRSPVEAGRKFPIIYRVLIHPRWCRIFFHQRYYVLIWGVWTLKTSLPNQLFVWKKICHLWRFTSNSWFHGYCTTGDCPERRAICDSAGNSHTPPTFLTLLQPPFDRKPRLINLFFGQWAMSDGDIFLDSLLGAHLPWKWLRETIGPKQWNTDMSKTH